MTPAHFQKAKRLATLSPYFIACINSKHKFYCARFELRYPSHFYTIAVYVCNVITKERAMIICAHTSNCRKNNRSSSYAKYLQMRRRDRYVTLNVLLVHGRGEMEKTIVQTWQCWYFSVWRCINSIFSFYKCITNVNQKCCSKLKSS